MIRAKHIAHFVLRIVCTVVYRVLYRYADMSTVN